MHRNLVHRSSFLPMSTNTISTRQARSFYTPTMCFTTGRYATISRACPALRAMDCYYLQIFSIGGSLKMVTRMDTAHIDRSTWSTLVFSKMGSPLGRAYRKLQAGCSLEKSERVDRERGALSISTTKKLRYRSTTR